MQVCRKTGAFNDPDGDCPECGGDVCLVAAHPGTDFDCRLCGEERYLPCSRCFSTGFHRHLQVRNRHDDVLSETVLCSNCLGHVHFVSRKPLLSDVGAF